MPSPIEAMVSRHSKDLIQHPLMDFILDIKWKSYVRKKFLLSLLGYVLFLTCFSISMFGVQHIADRNNLYNFAVPFNIVRLIFEILTCIWAGVYGVSEIMEAYQLGWRITGYEFKRTIRGRDISFPVVYPKYLESLWNLIDCAFFLTLFCSIPLRIAQQDAQWSLLAVSYVLCWVKLLKYTVGVKKLGPFVLMLARIFTKTIPTFLAVFLVILFGFTGAFFILLVPISAQDDWVNFGTAFNFCIEVLLGNGSLDVYGMYDEGGVAAAGLGLIFLLVTSVVMLNLLIAMMNDEYSRVASDIRGTFHLQRAEYIANVDDITSYKVRLANWVDQKEFQRTPKKGDNDDDPLDRVKELAEDNKHRIARLDSKLDQILNAVQHRRMTERDLLKKMEEDAKQEEVEETHDE